MIEEVGVVPMAALNVGIGAVIPGVNLKAAAIIGDIADLVPVVAGQVVFDLSPPIIPDPATLVTLGFNPAAFLAAMDPTKLVVINAGANLELLIELGLVSLQVELLEGIVGSVSAGMTAGGIVTWAYAGDAEQFEAMRQALAESSALGEDVDAVIVVTDDLGAWGTFAAGFNVGGVGARVPDVVYVGNASTPGLLPSLEQGFDVVLDLLLELRAKQAAIELQLQMNFGINLPDLGDLFSVDINLELALGSLSAGVDLDLLIGAFQAQLDLLFDLVGDLNLALSTASLRVLKYQGPRRSMASEASSLLRARYGSSSLRAVVMAFSTPQAHASFSTVFAV